MTKMTTIPENYNNIRAGIVELLKTARSATARNVNSIMTAVYWDIGRRIVKFSMRASLFRKVITANRRMKTCSHHNSSARCSTRTGHPEPLRCPA
jgi:hypothetical protein